MHIPLEVAPLLGRATTVPRRHQPHADPHGGAAPTRYTLPTVGRILTRSIVWALIAIAVWLSLLGLAALSTAGNAQPATGHRPHSAHRPADKTTRSGIRTPGHELHDTRSPPASASTSQA